MRNNKRWIAAGATAVTAAAIAAAVAVPAMAQQTGGRQVECWTAVIPVAGSPDPVAGTPATPKPSNIPLKICAASDVPLTPVAGSPDLSNVTPATARPVSTVPVVVGQNGITGVAPAN